MSGQRGGEGGRRRIGGGRKGRGEDVLKSTVEQSGAGVDWIGGTMAMSSSDDSSLSRTLDYVESTYRFEEVNGQMFVIGLYQFSEGGREGETRFRGKFTRGNRDVREVSSLSVKTMRKMHVHFFLSFFLPSVSL